MISGAHSIIYSKSPEEDRAFLRDVLGLPHVDVGQGWLIFGLPPAEVAVHPSEKNDLHEFYLICSEVEAFVREMKAHDIACTPPQDMGWGILTQVSLPGGGKLGVYQPRHARPKSVSPLAATRAKSRARASKAGGRAKPAGKSRAKPAARARPKAVRRGAPTGRGRRSARRRG